MWRMQRGDCLSHAVIDPRSGGTRVVWFFNDRPLGYRQFDEWAEAMRWSEQLQAQNWAAGWRLVSE